MGLSGGSESEPAPGASASSSMSRKDGFFMSERRFIIFCRSNELGGRDTTELLLDESCRTRAARIGGGESGMMGTTLVRFDDAGDSTSLRSLLDGRRRGGGGRLAFGMFGECDSGYVDVEGEDIVRLAWAVDGRMLDEGALCEPFASSEELRAGPLPFPLSKNSVAVSLAVGESRCAPAGSFVDGEADAARETPPLLFSPVGVG